MRHPDFDDRIVAFADMLHGRTELYDDNSHGTHVSSIIGGSGGCPGADMRECAEVSAGSCESIG